MLATETDVYENRANVPLEKGASGGIEYRDPAGPQRRCHLVILRIADIVMKRFANTIAAGEFKSMNADLNYRHVQRAPLCLLVYASAVIFIGGAWFLRGEPALCWPFVGAAAALFIVGGGFHYLAVVGESDGLSIRFGPLPLFRRKVIYADIHRVETGRTTLLDGWGIHYSSRNGWLWNIWGRDCVVLYLQNGVLRVGSDDAERLADHIRSRLSASALEA